MNYQNWTEEQKAACILEALSRKDISVELRELIQDWLLGGDLVAERACERVMDGILDRMFNEALPPVPRTYRSLARLHERLGLPELEMPAKKRLPSRRLWLRAAAILVPLLVAAGMWRFVHRPVPTPVVPTSVAAMVEVLPDTTGRIVLPDGTIVRLSGESQITTAENFTENRSVHLTGEAFFSVAKNEEKPFTVATDRLTVTVLGTEFHMKAYPETMETVVSLTSGRVEVMDGSGSTVLAPMEQLIHDRESGESVVAEFSPEHIDRWRFGEQTLDDVSLSEALRMVGLFYGKETVIEEGLPHELGVTTTLKETETIESVLEAIRLMNDAFVYTITGDNLYIEKK